MTTCHRLLCFGLILLPLASSRLPASSQGKGRADLTILIVVDQLRPQAIRDWKQRQQAHVYEAAALDYSCTETAPGHATLLSGRLPARHGIVANQWYERLTFSLEKAGADPKARVIGGSGVAASPRQFYGAHLSQAWKTRYPQSRFVAISWKDRAAVMLGGPQADLAFWAGQNGFVTSDYYTLSGNAVSWLTAYNQSNPLSRFAGRYWLGKRHQVAPEAKDWSKELSSTPYSDEATLEFVLYTVQELKLGQGSEPDFLAVSFSGTDYIAHRYSYLSSEIETQLYTIRELLSRLESSLRQSLPGRRLVFALTADHGGTIIEEQAKLYGVEHHRPSRSEFQKNLYEKLKARHPYIENALLFQEANLYLHYEAIGNPLYPRQVILQETRESLLQQEDVFAVVQSDPGIASIRQKQVFLNLTTKWPGRKINPQQLANLVAACYFPQRSPDLYVIFQPWVYLQEEEWGVIAGHGSPFADDRRVPLMLWGDGISARHYSRPVTVRQLAVTLAKLAGVFYLPADGESKLLPGF